jgi:inosine-uridine nucleoside N-ribohydrolase
LTPAVIDTDPGLDDALALLFAWGSPELAVEAVTTVAGNVGVDQATVNLLRLLDLRRPVPAPILGVGAAAPLARPLVTSQGYHGSDGMGDLPDWPPVEMPAAPPATEVMLAAARRHGQRLVLVALGPLTNVAVALRADRRAMTAIGRLVVMGGAVDVRGNVTPTAEFNAHVDPDAMREVFAAGWAIDLVPLDATRQALLTPEDLAAALRDADDTLGRRVRAIVEPGLRKDLARGSRGMVMHDPLAVALAIDPTLAGWESLRLEIGPDGQTRRARGEPNCRVALRVETARFGRMLAERLVGRP